MKTGSKRNINKNEEDVYGFFEEKSLTELRNVLMNALEIPFSVIDFKGELMIDSGGILSFCDSMKKERKECKECQMTRAFAAAKSAIKNKMILFQCPLGLAHMTIPVIINNQYMGAVVGGPVRCPDFCPEDGREGVIPCSFKQDSFRELPVYSNQKFEASANLVFLLLQDMGNKSASFSIMQENSYIETIENLQKKNEKLEEKLDQYEEKLIKRQLPNQLFLNILTTISSISILEDAKKTENVIAELSSVFRYTLDQSRTFVSIREEIGQIEKYLTVIKEQFGDLFDFAIHCETEMENLKIPTMSLFPVAEKLVDFDILARQASGTLHITIKRKNNDCKISLCLEGEFEDLNGNPGYDIFDEEKVNLQINNIKKRFQKEYGDKCLLDFGEKRIEIILPLKKNN